MRRAFFSLIIIFLVDISASGEELPPPFRTSFAHGERLTYHVTWFGIPAGTSVLEVKDRILGENGEMYHIMSTTRTNAAFSLFFPVEDYIESFVDAEGIYSRRLIVRQREGRHRREKEVIFDQVNHKATMMRNGEATVFDIPPRVQDFLSSLYYFRTIEPAEPGNSVFIDVHESRRNWQLEVRTLEKEQVTTRLGTFDTLKVVAYVRFEGILMDKGDMFIWFTDDERKIPVKMRTWNKVGLIVASLLSWEEGAGRP